MVSPWDWPEHWLLVTSAGVGAFLVDHLEQHEFLEQLAVDYGPRAMTSVVPLSQDAFEFYVNGGQHRVFD